MPEERKVTTKDVDIDGFLDQYIEVVNGDYKLTRIENDISITIKFKLKENPKTKICQESSVLFQKV